MLSLIPEIIAKVVAALLAFWAGERQRRENEIAREELGAARAESAGLRANAAREAQAQLERSRVEAQHSRDATDAAFDGEFERHE